MNRTLSAFAIAFGAALLVIAAFIAASAADPAQSLAVFFARPFSSPWYIGNTLDMAGLMILAATGSALALRSGTFNLGGEAQIYVPALVASIVLTRFLPADADQGNAITASLLALSAAVATGALLGFVPGLLRARFGISELLSSFLLSAALIPVADYLVSGPFRDISGNLVATPPIAQAARLPELLPPSHLNYSFAVAIALALLASLFLAKTGSGYRLRMTGTAPEFARFAGFPVARVTVAGMTVAGAFHALAGYFAVTGTWYRCHQGFSSGMGWSALAVALIARKSPLAVIPAAIVFSWLETAAEASVLTSSLSFDPTPILQAVIFLVISAQYLPLRRHR